MKLSSRTSTLLLLFLGAAAVPVQAQQGQVSYFAEQVKVIRAPSATSALGPELFGDKVNLYNGGLEFIQTDDTLPGNNALPVMIGRRLTSGSEVYQLKQFGNWELEIPHLHGTYTTSKGWTIAYPPTGATVGSRCSYFQPPPPVAGDGAGMPSHFEPDEYWHGHQMYIPGQGDQTLLARSKSYTDGPKDGLTYPVVTQRLWALRCLPTLANDTSANKDMGEGFIAISPDGTQYRFDWLATRPVQPLYKPGGTDALMAMMAGDTPSPDAYISGLLGRSEVWIMPTTVTDRFGNTVTYTYDISKPWQLTSIQASDGRTITLNYVAGTNQINSIYDGTRTWQYSYTGNVLATVTLPDATTWQLGAATDLQQNLEINSSCDTNDILSGTGRPTVATLVHPSGAAGTFTLTQTTHGRSWVPRSCRGSVTSGTSYAYRPRYFSSLSLTHKAISGAGMTTMDWSYDYGAPNASWSPCDGCAETSTTTVADAKGNVSTYTFGNRYELTEGQLQRVDVSDVSSGLLSSTATHYHAANAGPYASYLGASGQRRGDGGMAEVFTPEDQRITTQQGTTFTWQANTFDTRARATSVTRVSSLPYSRTETTAYADNRADWTPWVLGLVESITESSGPVMVANTYHPSAATLLSTSHFGHLDKNMTYNADGTLATQSDPLGHITSFSNYWRGVARNILYPDSATESADVNNIGKITRLTDANGLTSYFDYDVMGRIAKVTPPAEAGATWNPTTITFARTGAAEYGADAGVWRQEVTTGNGRTGTYLDALWRPVRMVTYDTTNPANPSQYIKKSYDATGHESFVSYPQTDQGKLDVGVRSDFDALGRVTASHADSELGMLTSSFIFGAPFTKTHTDPRGHSSTSSFQAFDTPSEAAIVSIATPVDSSVTPLVTLRVDIARDVFGKPLSITRSGDASATRSYVYDANQRLCKTIEAETGAEILSYDAANNINWRAPGLGLTSATCDPGNVTPTAKISFGYDAMNRLTSTTYGEGAAAITRDYWPDGLPKTVASGGATWTLNYNNLRLPTTQVLTFGGQNYTLTNRYDGNGHLSQLDYPSENNPIAARSVAYAPDAIGRPSQVGTFASGLSYYANGAIAGFTYGNGKVHAMTQNDRQLPSLTSDSGMMQDRYSYDSNGNVTSIADEFQNISSRTLGYDDLNRLTSASAPLMWGAASYTYDVLDNIRTSTVGGRTSSYQYGARNLLDSLSSTAPSYGFTYAYDARGNVIQRGAQSFVFDQGNRLTSAPNRDSYVYDGYGHRVQTTAVDGTVTVSVYSPAGQLLYTRSSGGPNPPASTEYIYLHAHQIAEVKR